MKFFQEIGEGEMFPRGHGIAWRRWECNRTVTAAVPFNLVCGWARDFYRWLSYRTPTALDKLEINAHHNGYVAGVKRATDQVWTTLERKGYTKMASYR